jgi:transcriptional regulator with XRE-family HTH domain
MSKNIGARLKILRSMCGLSQKKFAAKYNIPTITYNCWEADINIPSTKGLDKCFKGFVSEGIDASMEWLLTGTGPSPKKNTALSKEESKDYEIPMDFFTEIAFLKDQYKNFESFFVNDNSMHPSYISGDIVGGRKLNHSKYETLVGQDCIIYTNKGDTLLRKMMQDESLQIIFVPINLHSCFKVIQSAQIEWIAPVFWHRKKID